MALSITPYITASIIIQLLGVIFPQVKELQQCKTKADKRKYEWILVFSGAGLACLESLTMAIGFGRKGLLTKYKWYYVLLITVIWTIMAILIAQIAGAKQNAVLKLLNSGYWFNTSKPWYTFGALIYLVLIFAFSYFYTEITMNPEEIANNIKKSGGNIAGIRAGSSTAEYLRKQMKYLIAIGSFCLCIIAIIPFIVSGLTGLSRLSFFGTSIIITVSVILETKKLILSKTQENYYMNRVKKGGLFRG